MGTVLDTRPVEDFVAGHLPGAVNIPVEEMAGRVHELPAGGVGIEVTDADERRVGRARGFLEGRGHAVTVVPYVAGEQVEEGGMRGRLWQPNPFLVEALKVIGGSGPHRTSMRAIDVACGTGRDAVYLAMRGYDVTAVDVLPDAIERAVDLGRRYGVAIRGVVRDLEREPAIFGEGFDLVIVFRYLQRSLFPVLRDAVRSGGHVVYETFHERTLETGRSPRNPGHLLKTGELRSAFEGWEILLAEDGAEREGRYVSNIVARRV